MRGFPASHNEPSATLLARHSKAPRLVFSTSRTCQDVGKQETKIWAQCTDSINKMMGEDLKKSQDTCGATTSCHTRCKVPRHGASENLLER